jgi:4-alpha-glucanotransferase
VLLPPRTSLASLNTHDTPTFAGYWTGADIDLRLQLGHIDRTLAKAERAGRGRLRVAVRKDLSSRGLRAKGARDIGVLLMRLQARSDAPITLVNLEDLWGETRPQNVPGTLDEYPNWRRRAGRTSASIGSNGGVNRVFRTLVRERAGEESPMARRRS